MSRKKPTAPAVWRNRIVGEAEVLATELTANPKNWRTHGDQQRAALNGVLAQVGWVQRVVCNKTTGHLIDGHARVEEAAKRGERVPVVYVELTPEEEALVLATLDPLGAMAGKDDDMLRALVADIGELKPVDLTAILNPKPTNGTTGNRGGAHQSDGLEFKVVIDCSGEQHQAEMLERFKGEGLKCRALIS